MKKQFIFLFMLVLASGASQIAKAQCINSPTYDSPTGNYVPLFKSGAATCIKNSVIQQLGLNIGIGTSPSSLFHIYNNTAATDAYLTIENTQSAYQAALRIKNSGTANADWIQYIPGSSTDLRFWRGSDLVTFQSGGNVGIGVSPSYKLDVNGNINIPQSSAYYLGGGANKILWYNSTSTSNIFVGVGAGASTTGAGLNNVFIGSNAGNSFLTNGFIFA